MAGPLNGLKVVEMAGLGPCPLAGQLLGDLGAEVILIDRKSGKYDPTNINNRAKRSIALNLKSEEGRALALKLIGSADVLIEGFRPGTMEKLGLGPEACLGENPALVYGRMTGWGQDGPLAMTAGHDINYLAVTGALHAIGKDGEPPIPPLNLVADYGGGTMFLLLGVLAALFERQKSGKGQVIDAAMVDGVPALMGLAHMMVAQQMWKPQRASNMLDGGAPFYRCYETADGKYLSVGPLEPKFFAELCARAGIDASHLSNQYDQEYWPERQKEYANIFKARSREEWMALFDGSDACVAPVLEFGEVMDHPHNKARGIFEVREGVMQAAPAPRFSRTPAGDIAKPAAPGGETDTILRELGHSDADIAELRKAGALT